MSRSLLAVLLTIGIVACSGKQETPLQSGQCRTNDDCPRGDECTSIGANGIGECQLIPCGGTCTSTQVCIAGGCRSAAGVSCATDPSRCPTGFTCSTAGYCGQNCTEDSNCDVDAGFTCNVDMYICTQCTFNADCTNPTTPICNPNSGVCVGCQMTSDCQPQALANGMICDPNTQACAPGCNTVADCPIGFMSCQGAADDGGVPGTCIQCTQNVDCTSPSAAVCDQRTSTCVQCEADSDCLGVSARCNPATNTCVACLHDLDCGDGKICDQQTFSCQAGCTGGYGDATCPPSLPSCDKASGMYGTCVACQHDSDCHYQQICDINGGAPLADGGLAPPDTCMSGCHTDEQCIPPADAGMQEMLEKTCDPGKGANGQCVQCRQTSDCPSGLECDPTLNICHCKGIGEPCTSSSQCGYSPSLGPPTYGCSTAERAATGAFCVTSVDCNEQPATTVNISASVCVMPGVDQGLPDQCPPTTTGCPDAGWAVELASDGTVGANNMVQYTAVCVPNTSPYACMNTCFSSPF